MRTALAAAAGVAPAAAVTPAVVAQKPDEDEVELDFTSLPAALQASIIAEAAGRPVSKCTCEIWPLRQVYTAEWPGAEVGTQVGVKLDDTGRLLRREVESMDRKPERATPVPAEPAATF